MRLGGLWGLLLWWQSSLVVNIGGSPLPGHLRFQRPLLVQGSGVACFPLDVEVLSHTASPAHTDLRIFRQVPGGGESETPYVFTESGPEPVADTELVPQHLVEHGSTIEFDLAMPPRPFSELKLALALREFVATASVAGRDAHGRLVPLGALPVYDLSGQGFGRWTSIQVQEASWPVLHIHLAFRSPEGQPLMLPPGPVLTGVAVPPSRTRQTRFVPTISTGEVRQIGSQSVATLQVPAHVPVERVSFQLEPGFAENFAREVTVTARARGEPVTNTEAIEAGNIVNLRYRSGDPGLRALNIEETGLDATLGVTLASPATVWVAVNNGSAPPLPIRAVELEMRERQMCFAADQQSSYMLRYGDPDLAAPVYDETALVIPPNPLSARLGPEVRNPRFHVRTQTGPLLVRHPELFWLAFLASTGLMCGLALHFVQHRRL